MDEQVHDDEYLYRGIVSNNWDFLNNRPSSATFKDSQGVSVDRDGGRDKETCTNAIRAKKDFHAVCKVLTQAVRNHNALVLYLPVDDNIYHSEIHGSEEDVRLKGKKPNRIRECSNVTFVKAG